MTTLLVRCIYASYGQQKDGEVEADAAVDTEREREREKERQLRLFVNTDTFTIGYKEQIYLTRGNAVHVISSAGCLVPRGLFMEQLVLCLITCYLCLPVKW